MKRQPTGGVKLILIDSAYLVSVEFIQESRHQTHLALIRHFKAMQNRILISEGAPATLEELRLSLSPLKAVIKPHDIIYISLNETFRDAARSRGYRTYNSILFLLEILDGFDTVYVRISCSGGQSRSELLRRVMDFAHMFAPFCVTYERPPAVYGIATERALKKWRKAGFCADQLGKAGLPASTSPWLLSMRGSTRRRQATMPRQESAELWRWRSGSILATGRDILSSGARRLTPLDVPSRALFSKVERRELRSLTAKRLAARLRLFAQPNECRFHSPGNQAAVMLIRQQLQEIGLEISPEDESALGPPPRRVFNVVGTLPGNTAGAIVIGCHLDSTQSLGGIHAPGADDNASGMAAVFCIAEMIRKMRTIAPEMPFRSLHFAFFNEEEEHCKGSSEWLKRNPSPDIRAMIQLDTIGYTAPGTRRPWAWQIHSKVFGERPEMEVASAFLSALLAACREELAASELLPPESTGSPVRSDHASFHTHHIPACCASEALFPATGPGRNPHLHRSTDTIEHINFAYAAAIARVAAGAAWVLATQ